MGKAAILIILSSVAFGSMYAFGAKEEVREAENRLSTHQYEVLARNAALAGYNEARQHLTDNYSGAPSTLHGTYEEAVYDVVIDRNGATANVRSTGTMTASDGREIDFMLDAAIEKESTVEMADEAPPFMRYAIMTDEDLNLNGNVLTDLYIDGDEANTLNANMHTNGSLSISGNALTVKGFGTYVQSATANPASALTTAFQPYYNPTNDPVTKQVTAIDVPDFDITAFTSKVDVDQTSGGDVALSGTYDLGGTRENPYVWYVDGNMTASGGTNIKGYVMFVVSGDISMSGNVDASQGAYTGSDESNVAFYAGGSVSLSGNAKVYGQIFSGGGLSFLNGTPRVYGSVATKGAVTLSGTPKIYYRVASPALTTIFEDGVIQYRLASYSEW
jgi:hypothetical protein